MVVSHLLIHHFSLAIIIGGFLRKRREASQRFAQKNNLPLLNNVTLPRQGAMKTIIDCLGQNDEDHTAQSSTPPSSMKNINKVLNNEGDEFYIDNEYNNQQTPPDTPLRNAYNANNHRNNNNSSGDNNITRHSQRIIDDDENLKEKMGEAEMSSKKTLKYVVDITIAYPNRTPLDLGDIVLGTRKSCPTHLLYRVYRSSEVCARSHKLRNCLINFFLSF
jgi:lysophosphatidylglycerol acyltransferase 1